MGLRGYDCKMYRLYSLVELLRRVFREELVNREQDNMDELANREELANRVTLVSSDILLEIKVN